MQRAQVVKLDRGYPLVRCEDGRLVRCEHATALVKGEKVRAVIGDFVEVNAPEGHDKGIIESICPRERAFVRKDPTERAVPQVLAANFDRVILAQPLAEVNLRRLERELVLAYETGAAVTVVLTKADLAESEEQVEQVADRVRTLAGPDVRTLVVSDGNTESVEAVRALMAPGTTTVLVGKSGVGKSSLMNSLFPQLGLETGIISKKLGRGKHTTRQAQLYRLSELDPAMTGYAADTPGFSTVDTERYCRIPAGELDNSFREFAKFAEKCRFADCAHIKEKDCAVRAAAESGEIAKSRYESYLRMHEEASKINDWE